MSATTPSETDGPVYDDVAVTGLFREIPHVVCRAGYTYCHTYENGDRRVVVTTLDESVIPDVTELAARLGFEPHQTASPDTHVFSSSE